MLLDDVEGFSRGEESKNRKQLVEGFMETICTFQFFFFLVFQVVQKRDGVEENTIPYVPLKYLEIIAIKEAHISSGDLYFIYPVSQCKYIIWS